MGKCAVIIPTHNRREITLRAVSRLLRPDCEQVEVIICDSNSTDGTRESCATLPSVHILNVGGDCWWTGAVDRGVRYAVDEGYDWIVVLNDDLEWETDLVGLLLQELKKAKDCLLVPLQLEAGGRCFRGGLVRAHGVEFTIRSKIPTLINVDFSNGCCICATAQTFKHVGFFDAVCCPHLGGDQEFFLRARNRGVLTVSSANVVVRQMIPTQLRNRYRVRTLLTAADSPYRWSMYKAVGIARHGTQWAFWWKGWLSHLRFAAGLTKAFWIASAVNRKW